MIAVIDYGMGNLRSVENALKKLNAAYMITADKEQILAADKIILPGVGAFGDCMRNLRENGLIEVLNTAVLDQKKLFLGICLGMQVLFESSEEGALTQGLGYLKGKVVKMQDTSVKIPHIGWNRLELCGQDVITSLIDDEAYVYYVHSYYASEIDEKDLLAYSNYGTMRLCGLIRHENIIGAQFHPEKSGETGLKILKYFVEEQI
ncbi:imidazole glycerol phosphate synthase subunit HisH [Dielma fastidiosa]|uniref:imidazole glycerol phosphate synthase subunit HisH n=1 Tax=Dielma fastidiosa TaxID=1034346 RepID=UPI000E50EBCC|nr:imidazole glycerol phosphate synthase subunit HisH [Dielma fastidiosa]RHN03041.1 imidazole glycerol phosphate synthase subunit HisH [Dielma fastidiosa]